MPENGALAKKKRICAKGRFAICAADSAQAVGLKNIISHWAQTETKDLNIDATNNVINGSPCNFVKSGLGCYVTTEDLLPKSLEKGVCFRPFEPALEIHYALAWKRYTVFSKAAEMLLEKIKSL